MITIIESEYLKRKVQLITKPSNDRHIEKEKIMMTCYIQKQ